MRLTILHVPDCPNVAILEERLTRVVSGDVEVTLRVVDSEELAAALGMTGSPTLLVDGVDPFAEPGRAASVSCRLYHDETGHPAGAPSVAQLRRALDQAAMTASTVAVAGDEPACDDGGCCAAPNTGSARSAGLDDWRARTAPQDAAGRAVHQAILRAFATTGRPPVATDLDRIAAAHGATTEKTLAELHAGDVIRLDAAGRIGVAYPFSATPTRHRVQLAGGVEVWAMCAVDALGIPDMLDTDAMISSSDPGNNQAVTITVQGGRHLWDPPTAVVFLSAAAGDGPSVDSCCNDLNFFTTPASAQAWITAHPRLRGEVLDPVSAERLGQDIFGALLAPDQDQVTAP
jgi:hypothetical protein